MTKKQKFANRLNRRHKGEPNLRQVYPNSGKLLKPEPKQTKHDFPWLTLECGQSFIVQFEEMKLQTLRPLVSNMNRKLNKKFKIAVHDNCYEVGRVE